MDDNKASPNHSNIIRLLNSKLDANKLTSSNTDIDATNEPIKSNRKTTPVLRNRLW